MSVRKRRGIGGVAELAEFHKKLVAKLQKRVETCLDTLGDSPEEIQAVVSLVGLYYDVSQVAFISDEYGESERDSDWDQLDWDVDPRDPRDREAKIHNLSLVRDAEDDDNAGT